MAIDKLKKSNIIKFLALGFYLMYFIFFNTSLNTYLPEYRNSDVSIKKVIDDYCFLIIGGSNARQGISAQFLSEKICPTYNLAINSEMDNFNLYLNWLNKNLYGKKYNYILYSPSIFWSDAPAVNENINFIKFPPISIGSQLKNFIFDYNFIFSSTGDINKYYYCNNNITSYSINEANFLSSNKSIAQLIKRRVSKLDKMININNIYLRVPPVYVKTEKQAEIYRELMNKRIEILKSLGIIIIGITIVSTDSSLFCDSFHPNAKGREIFSKEISLP